MLRFRPDERKPQTDMPKITFTLNGKPTIVSYEPGMHFLEVLREQAGITSAKDGCSPEGTCGCCTVLVNGTPVLSCLRKPEQMEGASVTTFEGLPEDMQKVLCQAFVHEGAVQCGFCIPGILVRASSLLQSDGTAERGHVREALSANLCRCTGWERILDGIQTAGEMWNDGKAVPRADPRRHFYFGEEYGQKRIPELASKHEYGIGRSPSKYRGLEQAAGERPFIDDMRVPGMVYGAPVFSAHPRAKIRAIDTAPAMAMPGVVRSIAVWSRLRANDRLLMTCAFPEWFTVHPSLVRIRARRSGRSIRLRRWRCRASCEYSPPPTCPERVEPAS